MSRRRRHRPDPTSYRLSHSSPGHGERYDALYRAGYEREQWQRLEQPLLESVFRERVLCGARSLLDFACGTGRILQLAERHFPITWGVDVSEPMLEIARRRCERSILLRSDLTVDALDGRFDVVTVFRFFVGAEPALRSAALRAIAAVLAPGGALVANVHVNRSSPLGIAYRITNRLAPGRDTETVGWPEFRLLLEQHGFFVRAVHWYSYLPRTGPWLPRLPVYLMEPIERLCRRMPRMVERMAQCFVVVAEAPSAGP